MTTTKWPHHVDLKGLTEIQLAEVFAGRKYQYDPNSVVIDQNNKVIEIIYTCNKGHTVACKGNFRSHKATYCPGCSEDRRNH